MTGVLPQRGATGRLIHTTEQLDALPAGTVVVPMWLGSPSENGLNAATKFAPARGETRGIWLRAIDNPNHPGTKGGVQPLGGGRDNFACRVVYDPRDV